MAGADMSKNLGGMLSQTAGALGNMGSTYGASLGRNIENMSRPDTDPTDIASQQALMQWQNNMGRTQESANTARNVQLMQANKQKADKAAAVQTSANLTAKLRETINDPSKSPELKATEIADLQQQLTDLSSLVGRDLSGTTAALQQQKTQIEQAAAREQRAVDADKQAKLHQATVQADRDGTNEYFQTAEADRPNFIQNLKETGNGTLASKLEDRYRIDQRWAEETAKNERDAKERAIPAVTKGERTLIDTDLETLKGMNSSLSEAWEAKIKGIEDDLVLTSAMKRQQIGKQRTALGEFITRQTSAAMTAARKASDKSLELDNPAQGLYISDGNKIAPAVQAVADVISSQGFARLKRTLGSESQDINVSHDDVREWVDSVGKADAARIAAAYVTTLPALTFEQALIIAAKKAKGQTVDTTANTVSSGNVAGSSENNRIKL